MKRRIAILGSTGSIGTQTLEVIAQFPDRFEVVGLTSLAQLELLEEQVERFAPRFLGVVQQDLDEEAQALFGRHPGLIGEVGDEVNDRLVREFDIDLLVVATVGSVGLEPTLAAMERGIDIALANKEVLVKAGDLVMKKSRELGVRMLPIDSELNAIFQCLRDERIEDVRRILLTASGGPFREWPREQLEQVKAQDALNHPTWSMGPKITIDSSTLMNKGFEVMEVYHLFGIELDKIEVVVHPQSVVHSMVEFHDGSVIAQLGRTDMRLPIQNCLTYPERWPNALKGIDWAELGALTFEAPDIERFPCLACAYDAIRTGKTVPSALNAANEVAVERFLAGEISFMDIPRLLQRAMERHRPVENPTPAEIEEADLWARRDARQAL